MNESIIKLEQEKQRLIDQAKIADQQMEIMKQEAYNLDQSMVSNTDDIENGHEPGADAKSP